MPRIRPGHERVALDVPAPIMAQVRATRGRGTDADRILALIQQGLDLDDRQAQVQRLQHQAEQMLALACEAAKDMTAASSDLRDGVLKLLEHVPARR